jgi:hypothetical protein
MMEAAGYQIEKSGGIAGGNTINHAVVPGMN